jgi:ribose 5-phosphate isomerase B
MKIAIGCDPNAQAFKEQLIPYIISLGHEVEDFGSDDVIYANTAIRVGEAVAAKKYDRGILICGTGIGISIAANKVKGAYCALVTDVGMP